jgi:demethylmenaquinone methyltransferase/2-methoxy-6-polyprenyl-1,4-benzoquinol methylase
VTHVESIAQPAAVREMFDRIAPQYDRFNALASLGLHQGWRKTLVQEIPAGSRVLDIATGTGDLAFMEREYGHDVTGLDFSQAMIDRARAKDKAGSIQWVAASADALPFAADAFDAVTSAFALRNIRTRLSEVFKENFRVLRPGGRVLHLDFGRPRFPLMRWGHRLHMNLGVPLIGKLLCGDRWPKGYLENTIDGFFSPSEVEDYLEHAGFVNVSHQPVMNGVVHLYRGTRAC